MRKKNWRRLVVGSLLAGGCLFAGPCGITTLQLQDFVTSSLIRTSVATFASLVEAATIANAQD